MVVGEQLDGARPERPEARRRIGDGLARDGGQHRADHALTDPARTLARIADVAGAPRALHGVGAVAQRLEQRLDLVGPVLSVAVETQHDALPVAPRVAKAGADRAAHAHAL